MIAVGVARPSAQGQAITRTAMVRRSTSTSGAPSPKDQISPVTSARISTPGTNTAEMRSASRWMGAISVWASRTMRTMPASTVPAPLAVTPRPLPPTPAAGGIVAPRPTPRAAAEGAAEASSTGEPGYLSRLAAVPLATWLVALWALGCAVSLAWFLRFRAAPIPDWTRWLVSVPFVFTAMIYMVMGAWLWQAPDP